LEQTFQQAKMAGRLTAPVTGWRKKTLESVHSSIRSRSSPPKLALQHLSRTICFIILLSSFCQAQASTRSRAYRYSGVWSRSVQAGP